MEQKFIEKMSGYKATNKDMVCNGFQFELGKWYEIPSDKKIELCQFGFHFCKYPSGVWSYYSEEGTRVFKVEAEDILIAPVETGADFKLVCRKIRLTEEIIPDGNRNTGNRNTGDGNTGDGNTGNRNTGDWNAGNRNTGDWNAGNRNTGDGNTGDGNTGNRNTGDGNTGDFHAGFFCQKEEKVICFDVQTKYTRDQFNAKYLFLYSELLDALMLDTPISFSKFKKLPNITKKKLNSLHKKNIDGRKNDNLQK